MENGRGRQLRPGWYRRNYGALSAEPGEYRGSLASELPKSTTVFSKCFSRSSRPTRLRDCEDSCIDGEHRLTHNNPTSF